MTTDGHRRDDLVSRREIQSDGCSGFAPARVRRLSQRVAEPCLVRLAQNSNHAGNRKTDDYSLSYHYEGKPADRMFFGEISELFWARTAVVRQCEQSSAFRLNLLRVFSNESIVVVARTERLTCYF